MILKTLIIYIFAALFSLAVNAADKSDIRELSIKMGAPFHDSAILQRGMKVPVWGWADPGTKITIQFAGQKKEAVTDKNGKWALKLDELKVNAKPGEMHISDDKGKTETLKDILVGEVWVASGQSNMQWLANKCDVGRVLIKQMKERVKEGKEEAPIIREAQVTNFFSSLHPIEHAKVQWSPGGDKSSAIAYAFAYKLYTELKVPIGILNCSFSQTSIQAWTPREGFASAKDEYSKEIYKRVLESDPSSSEHKKAWSEFYSNIEKTLKENEARVKKGGVAKAFSTKTPGNLRGNRDATWLFNARLNPMIPYAIRGAIWNQGYANMGEGFVYYNNLHNMIRGWRELWQRPELPVYFHQFYSPGHKGGWRYKPVIGSAADMRLGTWMARDIPNTGMASQIDMTGGIHYGSKATPGIRLALHALKKQYGQDIVVDGPMFKSYSVQGSNLIVDLDHAKGGLVVAETKTNARKGIATPTIIPNGESQVKFFYIADDKKIWHPATVKIDGPKLILSSESVKSPRGISYGSGGIGNEANIYNKALLPLSPFTYFDQKLVTAKTWPEEKLKVAGEVIDPSTVGKLAQWRSMPLLSTQFRDNAVLQAGQPITFYGSALHDWGHEAEGEAIIKLSFAGLEKTIKLYNDPAVKQLGEGETRAGAWKEWSITLPAMEASTKPKTLKVTFLIDGEIAHERVCQNILIGDVWYVAAPPMTYTAGIKEKSSAPVRMMARKAKRFAHSKPSRYSVCVSRLPGNRFASEWLEAKGFAAALGHRIGSKTGNPVGIVFMQSAKSGKPGVDSTEIKSWIRAEDLNMASSLQSDYQDIAVTLPGTIHYRKNAQAYVQRWKDYWEKYIPELIATKKVPDAAAWGAYPTLASSITTKASQVYNVMTHSFTNGGAFKGIIFLTSEKMAMKNNGKDFSGEVTALANSWQKRFAGNPHFFYTLPDLHLASSITKPEKIEGPNTGVLIKSWLTNYDSKTRKDLASEEVEKIINAVIEKLYK